MSWALLSINRHLIILKVKVQFKDFIKHQNKKKSKKKKKKKKIRSYCFDTEKEWNERVHLLLFVVRESVQESLGFSPFRAGIWPHCVWAFETFEREISLK